MFDSSDRLSDRSDEAFTRYDRRTYQWDRPVGPTSRTDWSVRRSYRVNAQLDRLPSVAVYCCLMLIAAAVKLNHSNCETKWQQTSQNSTPVLHSTNVNYTQCRAACSFASRCTAIKWVSNSKSTYCYLRIQPENVRYEEIRRCDVTSGLYLSTSRVLSRSFSALTLLVGRQEGRPACVESVCW